MRVAQFRDQAYPRRDVLPTVLLLLGAFKLNRVAVLWPTSVVDLRIADVKPHISGDLGRSDPTPTLLASEELHNATARRHGGESTNPQWVAQFAIDLPGQPSTLDARIVKEYGNADTDHRYSPAVCKSIQKRQVTGDPVEDLVSTSYVERQNLTMRMGMRRFTRLTNGFSKNIENHAHAVSLHFMHYNFSRRHQTLKGKTPAVAAGIERHPWSLTQIAELLD
jgi:hypothetical protein